MGLIDRYRKTRWFRLCADALIVAGFFIVIAVMHSLVSVLGTWKLVSNLAE